MRSQELQKSGAQPGVPVNPRVSTDTSASGQECPPLSKPGPGLGVWVCRKRGLFLVFPNRSLGLEGQGGWGDGVDSHCKMLKIAWL